MAQIALSSNHTLLVYIAYLIYAAPYQCLKKDSVAFFTGHFTPPAPPHERQEGRLLLSAPMPGFAAVGKVDWRIRLDNEHIVGVILLGLSKAFGCITHDLLIAKPHAYGLDESTLVLMYSYLKRRKQSESNSPFPTISSGVPQCSDFGSILLNFYTLMI